MTRLLTTLLLCLTVLAARADSGVLIPRDKQSPDPAILSLESMTVQIVIDNGDAHIHLVQIFSNHTAATQEGTYRFSLPSSATVSDFAVWDGPIRIPAVILERKRAQSVYEEARAQAIDPGLLQMGERSDSGTLSTAVFTAKIVPIPAYGTKRLELDYHQRLEVVDLKQFFAFSLKPDANQRQSAHHFALTFELHSALPITAFTAAQPYPLTFTTNDPHTVEATFTADNLTFTEDFQTTWTLNPALASTAAGQLALLTHRDPRTPLPDAGTQTPQPPNPLTPEPGFFEAQLLIPNTLPATPTATQPRTAVILFDNSLSMQWEKLERIYAALEATLQTLTPTDQFNVLLFNQDVAPFRPHPIPATPQNTQAALDFIRTARLRGGTDLLKALDAGLTQCTQPNSALILLTDGGSDRGASILPRKIEATYAAHWKASPHPPHTDVFAVGDDANLLLLRALARNGGVLEPVLSTEPIDFHLKTFLSRIVHTPVAGLTLTVDPALTRLVYPLDDTVYPGSTAQWIGQYTPSSSQLHATVTGSTDGRPFTAQSTTPLPSVDPAHPQLPRLWAQARVDALLAQIDREGESAAAIAEIIALSRRYKFVTPYTSFLAVPRSLLRPRVIRPGDPVLRVHTDPAIVSVIALFPFGLTEPLRHLATEDRTAPTAGPTPSDRLWETRFLAPPEMQDGVYPVRLILRDDRGNTYRESKTFVIASTPPTVKLELSATRLRRGQTLTLHAAASSSTRTLTARLPGAQPVELHWNPAAQTNTGTLIIPPGEPIGRYTLTVTAEDIAHNLGTQEVTVDVVP